MTKKIVKKAVNQTPKAQSKKFIPSKPTKKQPPVRITKNKQIDKRLIIVFVLLFGFVGTLMLVKSRASSTIKAQMGGVIDRQGQPKNSSYYPSIVSGFVVKNYDNGKTDTAWAALQPTQNGPIASNNSIDRAIASVRGTNVRLKLRIYAGSDAPEWAKNLPVTTGKQGPFEICSSRPTTRDCGTVGHFWEVNYRQAYQDFMTKMAAKYDNVPEIEEVIISACTTTFAEPMLRQGSEPANVSAYVAAGYNEQMNKACNSDALKAHKAWANTRSALSLNPYQEFVAANGAKPAGFVTNENYTEQYIDECRAVLGKRCVLGNNSIGKKEATYACSDINTAGWVNRDNYARMYTKIKCAGAPIYFQTSAPKGIAEAGNNLNDILTWAAQNGAAMVELPVGYDNPNGEYARSIYLSTQQLAVHDQALEANKSPAVGISDPPTNTPPNSNVDQPTDPGTNTPPGSSGSDKDSEGRCVNNGNCINIGDGSGNTISSGDVVFGDQINKDTVIAGDVNDDGKVNVKDTVNVIRKWIKRNKNQSDSVADVNLDGKVNFSDVWKTVTKWRF